MDSPSYGLKALECTICCEQMSIQFLKRVLGQNFPNDILMPVDRGTKRPKFCHKNNRWTSKDLDDFCAKNDPTMSLYDYSLILNDLCVVDIDSDELVGEMERSFPELKRAPRVRTPRGMHYYFTRSNEAYEHGYYDGAGQRRQGIDFKSVCQSGTGGIVVVPPSGGRKWLTDPMETITEISLSLLDAIAIPRHKALDATLCFQCGNTMYIKSCSWLHGMTYFEPFWGSDSFDTNNIPVPCDREIFQEILFILEHNSLRSKTPSRQMLAKLSEVAEMLGMIHIDRFKNKITVGNPRFQLDMYETVPSWWQNIASELVDGPDMGALVSVDSALSSRIFYNELKRDERWLFAHVKSTLEPGSRRLVDNPVAALLDRVPPSVIGFLRMFPTKVRHRLLGRCSHNRNVVTNKTLFFHRFASPAGQWLAQWSATPRPVTTMTCSLHVQKKKRIALWRLQRSSSTAPHASKRTTRSP